MSLAYFFAFVAAVAAFGFLFTVIKDKREEHGSMATGQQTV